MTLDDDGAIDHVPFMPEMVELCGKRFRVSRRVVKSCYSALGSWSTMREFPDDDVVTLDGVRCDGAAHDGCQKACMIFWRETWLRKVESASVPSPVDAASCARLHARLKTSTGPNTYFCQASEFLKATRGIDRRAQLRKSVTEVQAGNCNALQMVRRLAIWFFWKVRRKLLGEFSKGRNGATPTESLNLQPGEWVEVKPLEDIRATLNEEGFNRGMYFSPDLRLFCGGRYRVGGRLDKIILDGSGKMRQLRNTVQLEGSLCGCANICLGGCSRSEVVYWREIWLRRLQAK